MNMLVESGMERLLTMCGLVLSMLFNILVFVVFFFILSFVTQLGSQVDYQLVNKVGKQSFGEESYKAFIAVVGDPTYIQLPVYPVPGTRWVITVTHYYEKNTSI